MLLEHWHHVMHIFVCLINIMLPAIFVYKPFFQNKVFQVCPCLVLVVILLLFISVGAASSNFTRDRVVCWYRFRVTLIRVFSASRSCPSYWLRSSPDQIYQQYYYKYSYISTASTGTYLVFVARAEVFK